MTSQEPYLGAYRKLVLAFDVGTTFSGVGYAILDPGEVPKIQGVTRFPGQENGDFKIPSILWYAPDGTVRAAGAEARDPSIQYVAEDENLIFVEWFKLHLRPKTLASSDELRDMELRPLPPNKSVIDVFADFLAYLFKCAKNYIIESHPNGPSLWQSLGENIDIVLSHPNGWEGAQQDRMRQAAINAGLVPATPVGRARVSFVTEGEASIQYCVGLGMATGALAPGSTVMLVDAGGGTVDLSTYHFISTSPIALEEIAPIDCILQGSTRVNARAEHFLRAKLAGSRYGFYEEVKNMVDAFEKHTKPTFKDSSEKSYIRFGSMRDRDDKVGIRNGQLVLEGSEVAELFEPSVQGIVDAVHNQRRAASRPVSMVFLVGGFAASPWLFAKLKAVLDTQGINISRPDNHSNKAVAEGAVSSYLERFVAARIARWTYGVSIGTPYNPQDLEHRRRRASVYVDVTGETLIPNVFMVMLNKGTRITDEAVMRKSLWRHADRSRSLDYVATTIKCYRGRLAQPRWTDLDPDNFTTLCTVTADTSKIRRVANQGPQGQYYTQEFEVVLYVGRTEMRAQLSWKENGVEKRGPAQVIYYEA